MHFLILSESYKTWHMVVGERGCPYFTDSKLRVKKLNDISTGTQTEKCQEPGFKLGLFGSKLHVLPLYGAVSWFIP